MYLKALEIQGFKSFPEKTRLIFEKPVTAIVGPNGSGKSNISDALRWVMGEQSTKALRGGKMEDVIFGGTQKRGQLGFAEVSLILDNSSHTFNIENSEVMITRRYYRSGESEYYINKQVVRLRDINELLMDTGLGREGYSIIGQGKIDDILSAKSTDRREVFEEAAGISRYRHRKEESERKLQKAEDNLLRVNDKIAELQLQVDPLRRQAETAKKYLVLRDELRGLEISLWVNKLNELGVRSEALKTENEQAGRALEDVRRELQDMYDKGDTFAIRMRDKDVEAERLRGELSEIESRGAETESGIAVLRANSESNAANIQRLEGEKKQQEDRDRDLEAQIVERRKRIDEIDAEKTREQEKIDHLLSGLAEISESFGAASSEIAELFDKDNRNNEKLAAEKALLSSLASSVQEMEDKSVRLLTEVSEADAKIAETETLLNTNSEELKKAYAEAEFLKNIINGHDMRVKSRSKKAEAANQKKIKLTMDAGAVKSRIAMLTEMEKEFQGYSKAVKTVMQEASRGTLKNIHGPVADLIKTDGKYAVAIETALGGAMQNIIVDSEEDGKAAISFLKRRDAGRATFLPMTAVRGKRLNEPGLENEPGIEGIAVDIIKFDGKYTGIYTNLLGRTAVAENMDTAVRIAKKYGHRFRIVTLDGQLMNAGGSMTGGSVSRNAGVLSRANELEKLEQQYANLKAELEEAERETAEIGRELAAAQYGLNVASENLRTFEDSILKLETEKRHCQVLRDSALEGKASLKAEYDSTEEKLSRSTERINEARESIALCEKLSAELKSAIEEKSAGREDMTARRDELAEKVSRLLAEIASLEAESGALKKAVSEYKELKQGFSDGSRRQADLISRFIKENENIKDEIADKEKSLSSLRVKADRLRASISEMTEEKLKIEAERVAHDKDTQRKNNELLEAERVCARLEQKLSEAELSEKQIIDKLWDTYELSRTAAREQAKELESISDANKRTGELKREISKLGTPNIGAIEEFERVNTRYTYLTDQRDDIEKAKSELDDIIENITGEMKEIFASEFRLICDSFKETFTELFGGGKAELTLEDPEDILNCGIEIKVQPPGKSLKTLTLLSGGEKAFVAIALYFAIIKVRPVPFIVMDEIEAALDDANVIRFAEYLRQLSGKTQFLLITHRRGTMEEADVLYGVTMQEQGVSRILNIDLDEAEKTISK